MQTSQCQKWFIGVLIGWGVLSAALAQADPTARRSSQVPDRYVVVFKDSVSNTEQAAEAAMRGVGGKIHHKYRHVIKGFAASIPAQALNGIRRNPNVDYVESDQTVFSGQSVATQTNAIWGLDRVNQRSLPLDATYTYTTTASSVVVFIIDTGILAGHQEFMGRLLGGYSAINDGYGTNDCNGHGTHVAGTVGGTKYGVAKGVKLSPVRVLDCAGAGTSSGVIAGIDWMVGVAAPGSVANMSLGGGISSATDNAVANAVSRGITMVVAAGNSSADACNSSPARAPSAITVGATTNTDAMSSFSNFGTCVDVFAPGSSITSAWYTGSTAAAVLSGTSMASPHVAGVAALVQAANPTFTPAQVTDTLKKMGTADKLTGLGLGSPNLLAYSLPSAVATPAYTVAIKSIVGSAVRSGNGWVARASITMRDLNTGASNLPNAMVSGQFTNGYKASCLTGTTGSCTLTSTKIANATSATGFTVTNVSGAGYVYDPSQNAVTQITVRKP